MRLMPIDLDNVLLGAPDGEVIDLNLPTATPPVPATTLVTCVHCQRQLRPADADVVGLGYRCSPCSLRADIGELTGAPDVSDHLAADDRARFAERGRQLANRAVLVSTAMTLFALLLLVATPALSGAALKLLFMALVGGLAVGGYGYDRWRRFR